MFQDQVPSSDGGGLEFTQTSSAAEEDQPPPPGRRRSPIGWLLLGLATVLITGVSWWGISWWNAQQEAVIRRLAELKEEARAAENLVPFPADGSEHPLDPAIELARESLDRFQSQVIDYTATVVKWERIEGELFPRTTMFVKIRNSLEREGDGRVPLSVYIRFDDPVSQKGREVIWVDGENDGAMIVHEAGLLGFKRLLLNPTGVLAMMGNRYPITEMGIERLLSKMISRVNQGRQHANCEVQLSRDVPLGKSRGVRFVITHPERSEDHDFFRAEVELDTSNFSYLRYAAYDWPPKAGQPAPLLEEFIYQDVKLNPGLADDAFDPDNPEYNYP